MEIFKKLLKSKKFVAGIVAVLTAVLNDVFGKPVTEETMWAVVGLVAVMIGAQGIADAGKEKEIIKAKALKDEELQ